MFEHEYKCDICGHTFHAGITDFLETDVLPDAVFSGTGDPLGLQANYQDKLYCGPCSDQAFPQILGKDVKFKHTGTICF